MDPTSFEREPSIAIQAGVEGTSSTRYRQPKFYYCWVLLVLLIILTCAHNWVNEKESWLRIPWHAGQWLTKVCKHTFTALLGLQLTALVCGVLGLPIARPATLQHQYVLPSCALPLHKHVRARGVLSRSGIGLWRSGILYLCRCQPLTA